MQLLLKTICFLSSLGYIIFGMYYFALLSFAVIPLCVLKPPALNDYVHLFYLGFDFKSLPSSPILI